MPAYLCHGFRWHRKSIRYFVVLQDVDDAAPEWIVAPHSAAAFLESFNELFDFIPPCAPPPSRGGSGSRFANHSPNNSFDRFADYPSEERYGRRPEDGTNGSPVDPRKRSKSSNRLQKQDRRPVTPPLPRLPPLPPLPEPEPEKEVTFNDWSAVKLLEEFDPLNESMVSGPWAYVADYVVPIDMSISPMEEMMRYEERMKAEKVKAMSGASDETGRKINTVGSKKAGWLEKLRDQLQRGEDIRWYVVMCGDEERAVPEEDEYDYDYEYGYEDDGEVGVETRAKPRYDTRRRQGIIEDELEDNFEYRLPEFANYEVRPLAIQPLRLRNQALTDELERRYQNPTTIQEIKPAVPEKDYRLLPPPPNPLQNLQDVGMRTLDPGIGMRNQKSPNGIRRLFTKRQLENPI